MILVTAATGHIGPHLVQDLLARGEQVRAMTRDEAKARAIPALADDIVSASGPTL